MQGIQRVGLNYCEANVKDNIHFVNIENREKVLKALAVCLEHGLDTAFKAVTQLKTFTSCIRVEKTSLQSILKSATKATAAMGVKYTRGLKGSALLLVRTNDFFHLGDVIRGAEGKIDDAMSPEVVEACVQFFSSAFTETNRHFTELYLKAIECAPLEIINPDGKPGSLQPLTESYEGVLCASFEFVLEPSLDSRIQLLIGAELLDSLAALLPDYEPEPHVMSEVDKRRAMLGIDDEAEPSPLETTAPFAVPPAAGPVPRKTGDRPPGNWNIDLLLDVELPIVVSFGETEMQLKDILKFSVGSVIELDKSVNDPVVIKVNDKPIARGEVVMVDGNYGVRILEVESTAERLRSLG
jgi:flagellar motor switch protein FliN